MGRERLFCLSRASRLSRTRFPSSARPVFQLQSPAPAGSLCIARGPRSRVADADPALGPLSGICAALASTPGALRRLSAGRLASCCRSLIVDLLRHARVTGHAVHVLSVVAGLRKPSRLCSTGHRCPRSRLNFRRASAAAFRLSSRSGRPRPTRQPRSPSR